MNGCKPMPPITELGHRARTLTPRDRARPVVLREKPDGDSPVVGSLRVGEAALDIARRAPLSSQPTRRSSPTKSVGAVLAIRVRCDAQLRRCRGR